MMRIPQKRYFRLKKETSGKADLLVVSKQRSKEDIMAYYDLGARMFGENRVPELLEKAAALPEDIEWHYIGHLQKNKVRKLVPYLSCLQSLDSPELAELLQKECARINKKLTVLGEFHLAVDDTNKTGMAAEEAFPFFDQCLKMPNLSLEGIMVMGPHTDETVLIESVFQAAEDLFHSLQERYGKQQIHILSMGMSDDYHLALRHGSTMIRIGTELFMPDDE